MCWAWREGRQRYGLFTNEAGGILDDLMFANRGDHLFVVVNAGLQAPRHRPYDARICRRVAEVIAVTDRALLALQGPQAEAALARLVPGVAAMRFMDVAVFGDLWVSRSGYTGEDGFEISVPDGAGRGLCPGAAGDGRGDADRPWRARQPAAGGGALPLRP